MFYLLHQYSSYSTWSSVGVWYDQCDTMSVIFFWIFVFSWIFVNKNWFLFKILLKFYFFIFLNIFLSFITGSKLMSISFGHLLSVLCCKMYMYMGVIGIDEASIIPGVVVHDEKIITWVTVWYDFIKLVLVSYHSLARSSLVRDIASQLVW